MKKIILFFIMICCLLSVSSCTYDNFEEPKYTLSGKALYDGEAVGVRSGSSEFALFQDGYALHGSIPVYVAQDGSYSVSLFNGDYKLVRMGNAPWERPSNDTIVITVKGNTVMDIPVTPYLFVRNASFARNGNKVTARFTINKVVGDAKVEDVGIYLGKGILTDNNQKEAELKLGSAVSLEQEITAEIDIPSNLINESYIYARVGVKSDKSSEYCYSQSIKVALK
ncbi:DUF3823 domain-containing protein [uncultured Bacteroides sp.]|uniref:DUF3823 domain-containing protein n=1 Tax=uncultured Bacteroides sp. TaxID=162156 RepID=UPI0025DA0E9D|nr:DUF3823 domain-containing protein [uncultured Bacteroides sp.]